MTSKIPRPSPEIAIKSQSRITNPPTITADRDFFRFWGSRRGERGGEAEETKFIPPIQQGAFQRIHRGNTQAASPGRLQNAALVVALYHNEASFLHREWGAINQGGLGVPLSSLRSPQRRAQGKAKAFYRTNFTPPTRGMAVISNVTTRS